MSKICDLTKQAKRLGISVKTLHRWDESGKLQARRTLSNHRYDTEDERAVARGLQTAQLQRKELFIVEYHLPSKKLTWLAHTVLK